MFQQSRSIKKFQQLMGQSYHQLRQLGYSQLQSEVISGELYNQKFQDHLLSLMNFKTDTLNELVIRLALENIFELRQLVAISDTQIHSTEFFTYVNQQTFQDLKTSKQIIEELKNENPLPIFNFRERPTQIDQKQKIILFIGQTGVGKSSTINQIANYWILEDDDADFRVQLIPNRILKNQFIVIPRKQYHDPIILIDTPGFKDTEGFQKDEEISQQLQAFLQTKINQLDMICFIFKETESRFDDGMKYIFTRIMEMFGKDIAPCIQILLTFSDRKANLWLNGKDYQIKFIILKYPSSDSRTLIHIAFIRWIDYLYQRLRLQRREGIQQKIIVDFSQKAQNDATTRFVTDLRKLQHKIEQFQSGMKDNLNSMSELQQYYQKNEKIRKIQQVSIPIDDGTYVTNCLTCQETCHFPCQIKQDDFKSQCWAMRNENCTKCPNKCNWKFHKNNNFRFDMQQKEIINNQQRDQKQIVDEYQQKVVDCIQKSVEILDSLQTLNQNALLPQSHKYVRDYYDFLINHEEKQKKEGFIERKNQLQIMKDKLDLLESKVQRKQINQELAQPLMELVDDNLLRSTILKLNQQYQQDYQQVI